MSIALFSINVKTLDHFFCPFGPEISRISVISPICANNRLMLKTAFEQWTLCLGPLTF